MLNLRVDAAFSSIKLPYKSLQQEEVHTECRLVVSDIPNWHTGTVFIPGKEIAIKEEYFEIGQHMMLIKLPFLMHPQEVTLKFKESARNIKSTVQGVLESWDISKDIQTGNIVNALFKHYDGPSGDTSISHSFASQNNRAEMCRFLIVRISASAIGNHLATVRIRRWIYQFQENRLQTIPST